MKGLAMICFIYFFKYLYNNISYILFKIIFLFIFFGFIFKISYATDYNYFLIKLKDAYDRSNSELYASLCDSNFKKSENFKRNISMINNGQFCQLLFPSTDIQLIVSDFNILVKFIPVQINENNKYLYRHRQVKLINNNNKWEIVEDDFCSPPNSQFDYEVSKLVEKNDSVDPHTVILIVQIIDAWRVSWENENLSKYMSYYADHAQIKRTVVYEGRQTTSILKKNALYSKMKILNKQYKWISIKIKNIELKKKGELIIIAQFLQEFQSGIKDGKIIYQDLGLKILQFEKIKEEWKITNEEWKMYQMIPFIRND